MKTTALMMLALLAGVARAQTTVVLDNFDDFDASPWGYAYGVSAEAVSHGEGSALQLTFDGPDDEVILVKPLNVPQSMTALRLDVRGASGLGLRFQPLFKDRQGFVWKGREFGLNQSGWQTIERPAGPEGLERGWRLGWWQQRNDPHHGDIEWAMTFPLQLIGFRAVNGADARGEIQIDNLAIVCDEPGYIHLPRSVVTTPQQGGFPVDVFAGAQAVRGDVTVRVVSRNDVELQGRQCSVAVNVAAGASARYETSLRFDQPGIYVIEVSGAGLEADQRMIQAVSREIGPTALRELGREPEPFTEQFDLSPRQTHEAAWETDDQPPMAMYVSELSPAWLMRNNSTDRYQLFAGTQQWGLGAPTMLAIPANGRTIVVRNGQAVAPRLLENMDKPWLLAWFTGAEGYDDWDCPYLVVLQHKPTNLSLDDAGLSLEFGDSDSAGYLALLPLYGGYKPPQPGNLQFVQRGLAPRGVLPHLWARGLPEPVIERCDWWSRVLRAYPVDCSEEFRLDLDTDEVIVRNRFTYLTTEDDWGTEPLRFAPIPPVLANCVQGGTFPVAFDQELHDPEYPTCYGPWMGIPEAEEITYRMHVLQYIHEGADITAEPDDSPIAAAAMDALTRYASSRATNVYELEYFYDRNVCWGVYNHDRWRNSNLLYVDHPGVRLAGQLTNQRYFVRRVFWRGQFNEADMGLGKTHLFFEAPGWGLQGDGGKISNDCYYTAWLYAYATGDYQSVADRWEPVIERLNVLPYTMCWARYGRDSIAEGGDEAPPPLGMARVAWAIGDMDAYAYASYLFARELTHAYLKVGVGADFFRQNQPIHPLVNADWKGSEHWPSLYDQPIPERANVTNMWSETAGWIIGGPPTDTAIYSPQYWQREHPIHGRPPAQLPDVIPWAAYGSGQWVPKWARFDAEDVFRFYHDVSLEAAQDEFDTWQRVEFPGLPQRQYGPVVSGSNRPNGHDGYPTTPWRLMQLRSDVLFETDEQIARLFPPENWPDIEIDQTFYQGMLRSAMPRQTIELIEPGQGQTPWQTGIPRDAVNNPSWDNPVMTPAGVIVTERNSDRVRAVNWPTPCYYMARPPRVPGGEVGTGSRWSFGYITPGTARPRQVEKQPINWVCDMYRFE